MGDNSFDLGGLMVLEGSNNHSWPRPRHTGEDDVDAWLRQQARPSERAGPKAAAGPSRARLPQLRRSLGYDRWLTADYRMGDVVLFNVYTVHGGTDNVSNKVRISTDTRYQRAGAAVDERWVGEDPPGVMDQAREEGTICWDEPDRIPYRLRASRNGRYSISNVFGLERPQAAAHRLTTAHPRNPSITCIR